VSGELAKSDSVLVDVGTGFLVEKVITQPLLVPFSERNIDRSSLETELGEEILRWQSNRAPNQSQRFGDNYSAETTKCSHN
jgi:hypothetical protein